MDEVWRPIPDFPGYEASNLGRIKSVGRTIVRVQNGKRVEQPIRERILKAHPYAEPRRHMFVSFSGRVTRPVHRLVLEAFVGPCPPGMECCHLDDDGYNNRLENLRWDTRSANQAIAEHEIREYAEQLGYHVGILTDGTIVCEPRPDPNHCETCRAGAADWHDRAPAGSEGGDDCARCGDELTVLTRCQRVVMDEGLSFHLRFLCPKCYAIESAG